MMECPCGFFGAQDLDIIMLILFFLINLLVACAAFGMKKVADTEDIYYYDYEELPTERPAANVRPASQQTPLTTTETDRLASSDNRPNKPFLEYVPPPNRPKPTQVNDNGDTRQSTLTYVPPPRRPSSQQPQQESSDEKPPVNQLPYVPPPRRRPGQQQPSRLDPTNVGPTADLPFVPTPDLNRRPLPPPNVNVVPPPPPTRRPFRPSLSLRPPGLFVPNPPGRRPPVKPKEPVERPFAEAISPINRPDLEFRDPLPLPTESEPKVELEPSNPTEVTPPVIIGYIEDGEKEKSIVESGNSQEEEHSIPAPEVTKYLTHTETVTRTMTATETSIFYVQGRPFTKTEIVTSTLAPRTIVTTVVGEKTEVNVLTAGAQESG
jgi:hypothetical protein